MLAVAIVGVITQIVVIGYEMGPMIVEKAQSAVAIFKRIFWFVAKRTCGWEPSEDGGEESGVVAGTRMSRPRRRGRAARRSLRCREEW